MYSDEAEEFDGEFIEKYDEDLNATLIFVRFFPLFARSWAYPFCRLVCFPR